MDSVAVFGVVCGVVIIVLVYHKIPILNIFNYVCSNVTLIIKVTVRCTFFAHTLGYYLL